MALGCCRALNGTELCLRSIGPRVGGEPHAGRDPAADDEIEADRSASAHAIHPGCTALPTIQPHACPRPAAHKAITWRPVSAQVQYTGRAELAPGRSGTRRSPPSTGWRRGRAMRRCRCALGKSSFRTSPRATGGRGPRPLVGPGSAGSSRRGRCGSRCRRGPHRRARACGRRLGRTLSSALGSAANDLLRVVDACPRDRHCRST